MRNNLIFTIFVLSVLTVSCQKAEPEKPQIVWDTWGVSHIMVITIEKPNTTPDGISDPAGAVQLLESSVNEIETKFGSLEVPWGDYYRISYNGIDLPANGVDGSVDVFRVGSLAR